MCNAVRNLTLYATFGTTAAARRYGLRPLRLTPQEEERHGSGMDHAYIVGKETEPAIFGNVPTEPERHLSRNDTA